ncbi:hypothetical protein Hdeb2414_s0005g00161511 [Helianthus debilis subsp. tardiflorus]
MAINLYSETSGTGNTITTMSPRISFSHDFSQSDTVPVEQLLRSLSSSDFNFCINQHPDASMADELFSDGKIIPTQIKQQLQLQPPPQPPLPPQSPPHQTKSFWGFKRSSSCGNGYARSLCPIPLLSRSNSTGSSTSTKRSSSSKKPPLRKMSYSYGNNSSSANGVRINPVLNLGFGSLFSSDEKTANVCGAK